MKGNKSKSYIHFDVKKRYSNKLQKYIENRERIKSHGFYPFIHYEIKFKKFVLVKRYRENGVKKEIRKKKDKTREIKYAAHIDRFIYQHYGNLLNDAYNEKVKLLGINKACTAYRNNFKGKSNIHFAREVFDFISKQERSFIFLGDFTKFFENLDHSYLKDRLKDTLGKDFLPDEHYAIFKNVTKYSYIKLEDIEKYLGKKHKKLKKDKLQKFFDTTEFKKIKTEYLKRNENSYGIPQGSSISSVYSNVYMMMFDYAINNFVTGRKGIYRRYSDDFIVVIPFTNDEEIPTLRKFIFDETQNIPNLDLQPEKTEEFIQTYSRNPQLLSIDGKKTSLNYLGFNFNGKVVKIRDGSLFKYYSRAYKKVKTVLRNRDTNKERIIRRKLYNLYTYIGDRKYKKEDHGNFITYAKRAHKHFSESPNLESHIYNQVKRHWKKINNRLKQ